MRICAKQRFWRDRGGHRDAQFPVHGLRCHAFKRQRAGVYRHRAKDTAHRPHKISRSTGHLEHRGKSHDRNHGHGCDQLHLRTRPNGEGCAYRERRLRFMASSVHSVGGVTISGGSTVSPVPVTGATAVVDPFASLPALTLLPVLPIPRSTLPPAGRPLVREPIAAASPSVAEQLHSPRVRTSLMAETHTLRYCQRQRRIGAHHGLDWHLVFSNNDCHVLRRNQQHRKHLGDRSATGYVFRRI
jgi:hypothetical protein